MARDDAHSALRRELETVEAEIAELRTSAEGLRRQIGERWFEPTDESERAVLMTAAEEQEALVGSLQTRREDLLKLLEHPE